MRNQDKPKGVFTRRIREVLAGLLLLAAPLAAQDGPERPIKVVLAVDRGLDNRAEWRIAAARLLDGCFRSFRQWSGLSLRLDDVVTWNPEPGRRPLAERLTELRRKVRRGSGEILLGVMSPERTRAVPLGIASYPYADILIKNVASREAMTYVILHEICHVFGAVDIREKGSLMGIDEPGFAVDAFTLQAVRLNAGRSFDRGPGLTASALDRAVSLFEERARLGLREIEVHLFLTLFYLDKNDLDAAALACEAAAAGDPAFPGLRNLMGNIHLYRGDYERALAAYRKASKASPTRPGSSSISAWPTFRWACSTWPSAPFGRLWDKIPALSRPARPSISSSRPAPTPTRPGRRSGRS